MIRLEELAAKDLLALEKPTLLSLIGLSVKFEEPEKELRQAVARIRQESDNEDKRLLLNTLISLIRDKELIRMVQEWSSTSEYLDSLPFRQMMREEVLAKEREEGTIETLRQNIMSVLICVLEVVDEVRKECDELLASIGRSSLIARVISVKSNSSKFGEFFTESQRRHISLLTG
ncbi:MAG: hypothetical protein R2880_11630 [Deinococcales bacterium]